MNLREFIQKVGKQNQEIGWYKDPKTGKTLELSDGRWAQLVNLIHGEISEAVEGRRKNLMDDHLPHRKMEEVEMADAFIRLCDLAFLYGYDLEAAAEEKLTYNKTRHDHKLETRSLQGGKKF